MVAPASGAVEAHRRAVKQAPKSPKALFNAGLAFREGGHTKAAQEHFNRAIRLEPTYALCRVEHAVTLLMMGEWQTGFKELEIRFTLKGRDPRRKNLPTWNGTPPKGQTVLINYEGDEGAAVQFSRFASAFKRMGAKVVMECPAHLTHLFSAMPDIDATCAPGADAQALNIDMQVPLMSLPARLSLTVDNLPAELGYLSLPKFGGAQLNIRPGTRLAVGLVWSEGWDGRAEGRHLSRGSAMLEDLDELLGIPGVQFFSLERGLGAGDVQRLGMQHLLDPVGTSIMDLADLAGVVDQLDLVIGVNSPTVHVAGALGKPVWTLLAPGADWCWLAEREDSPWYPSMRLFRRKPDQDWHDAVTEVRKALMGVLKGEG